MTVDLHSRDIQPLRQTFDHVARLIGGDKPASRYQEATLGAQPSANFHYRPTWDPAHELFDPSRTAIVLADWYVLRDPRQFYYATWTMTRARQQDAVEANYQFVESRQLLEKIPAPLVRLVLDVLMPLRHLAWGGNMNNCLIGAYGYGTAFTAPAMFHAMDQLGVAQYLTRLGLAMGESAALEAGKTAWLQDPTWQGLRHYVEDSLVLTDPFEVFVIQNFALDGLLYPLIYSSFVDQHVAAQGGAAVAMLTSFMPEWHEESARWIDAVIKAAASESEANQNLLSAWVKAAIERAQKALQAIATLALPGSSALEEAALKLTQRAQKAGLSA